MLPQHERLRNREDFALLRKDGTRYSQRCLSLIVLKEHSERRLAGYIVSKRISKKAVVRNRVKRRLRASFEKQMKHVKPGSILLFIARPNAATSEFSELDKQVNHLLKKAQVL